MIQEPTEVNLTHVDHLRWLKSAQFCWTCKAPLTRNTSGCQLKCSNSECGNVFHPQTSPVGISLIASEDHSRALLIRQSIYPPGMYSCVAGNLILFIFFFTSSFYCEIYFVVLQLGSYFLMVTDSEGGWVWDMPRVVKNYSILTAEAH